MARSTNLTDAAEPEATAAAADKVIQYEGYRENTYRLLFPHEDTDTSEGQTHPLITILPSGLVETSEEFECKKGQALFAYRFPQSLEAGKAQGKVEKAESTLNGTPYFSTPFVWDRGDGTICLVQTWSTCYNEKFKSDFKIWDSNPNTKKFDPQAVTEFEECMARLFGRDASKKQKVLFCHKTLDNVGLVYRGKAEKLIELLKNHPDKMENLAIKNVSSDGLSFVAAGKDGDGGQFEETFTMAPGEEYVMYKKVGWDTMGCVKPTDQFLQESEFLGLPRQL